LIGSSPSTQAPPRYNTWTSKVQTLFKALRLNAVYGLVARCGGKRNQEVEKVAIFKHRGHAFLRSFIHLIPVGAAFALVLINAHQYYIGGELAGVSGQDAQKLAALQFAAKLHELLMLASITAVLFAYIRREVSFGEGVPFGALLGGLQVDSVSFLWSQEFWGTIYHKWDRKHKKFNLILLLVCCTLLGVSVGPSTAQLMRPRLDYWPAGGTTFWINGTQNELYPKKLDASEQLAHCNVDTGDLSCPHGGWQILDKAYCSYLSRLKPYEHVPASILIDSPFSQRSIENRIRDTGDPYWTPGFTIAYTQASTPISAVADGIVEISRWYNMAAFREQRQKRLWSRNEVKYSVASQQPAVSTRCNRQSFADNLTHSEPSYLELQFPDLKSLVLSTPASVSDVEDIMVYVHSKDDITQAVRSQLTPGAPPTLIWFDNAQSLNETNSTLQVVAVFPSSNNGTQNDTTYSCSIDSRYIMGTTSATRDIWKIVYGGANDFIDTGTLNADYPKIALTAAWAEYLNPTMRNVNATIFSQMASSAGLWNSSVVPNTAFNEVMVESIITLMVLNGLARASYNITMAGTAKGGNVTDPGWPSNGAFLNEFLPQKSMGWGGNAFDISPEEARLATMFTAHVEANGYAYNHRGLAQVAAMGVLLAYCSLALFHFFYSTVTGWTSNAWDTAPEVVALAMNSKPSGALYNTGAGIVTVPVFEETVRVRVKDEHLEIVFKDTTDGGEVIRPNHSYG